jgi:hypothetical protein
VIGKERAQRGLDWAWKLDEKKDLGELFPLLTIEK